MSNPIHLEILRLGIPSWNEWRRTNKDIKPDLSGADLSGHDFSSKRDLSSLILRLLEVFVYIALMVSNKDKDKIKSDEIQRKMNDLTEREIDEEGINFSEVNLSGANLAGANLSGAQLGGVDLSGANLRGAILESTDFVYRMPRHGVISQHIFYLLIFPLRYIIWHFASIERIKNNKQSEVLRRIISYFIFNIDLKKIIKYSVERKDHKQVDELFSWVLSKGVVKQEYSLWDLFVLILSQFAVIIILILSLLAVIPLGQINRLKSKILTHSFDVDLTNAELSGCRVDKEILSLKNIRGCIVGVNGVYCPDTDSAALFSLEPPGDSMLSSNPDAIIEGLKYARKLYNISLSLAALSIFVFWFELDKIEINIISNLTIASSDFYVVAILSSLVLLAFTESFIRSSLEGLKYINKRESVMRVAYFPWVLSKYDNSSLGKWKSFLFRIIICAHPIIYIYYFLSDNHIDELNAFFQSIEQTLISINDLNFNIIQVIYFIAYYALFYYAIKIFVQTQRFQKPIFFDAETERNRKDSILLINERLDQIIAILKNK